ncbi:MAG: leucyl aminopeptidase [Alcanivoracaceae bacterium]
MEYAVSGKSPSALKTDCLILALDDKATLLPADLPEDTASLIRQFIKEGDFTGKRLQTLMIPQPAGLPAKRLLLIGTGELPLNAVQFLKLVGCAVHAVRGTGSRSAAWVVHPELVREMDVEWQLREGTRAVSEAMYQFDECRSKPAPAVALKSFTFAGAGSKAALLAAVKQGQAIGKGVAFCRDLGNRPPNLCFPTYLTEQARALAARYPALKVSVISEQQAEKMGMGAFCAVARGSEREGQIICMEYKGAKGAPVALVGKGITFDTGGISLKPGAGMDEMKYDMGGAASVFGTVKAVCELELPIHLVAVIAAAENMPDGRASRPGDIVTTLSGQTVEILNTDAEGRLVLCDALTWVQQKHKPHTVIDVATLTGACVVALGSHAQAIFANDHELAKALIDAGDDCGDRGWPMPLWDDYQEQLDSPFADMANIGGPKAGSVTAACFLSRFTRDVKWAHLDIAGTAWISAGKQKGATGRPVPLLTRYLMNLAGE